MPGGSAAPAGLEAWEERLWAEGTAVVAGTDEAGRGPLAGPVVAAAFAVLDHADAEVRALLASVQDSKQMSAQQRDEAFLELTHTRFEGRTVWAIAEASVAEIDEANILRAALSAMARAVRALKVRPECVLVDGCNRPPELLAPGEQWTRGPKKSEEDLAKQEKLSKWFAPRVAAPAAPAPSGAATSDGAAWRPRRVEAVIEGDARVPSISAASVLAKVYRDQLMEALDREFPAYGFRSHKGYGTEAHMEAIKVHGVCPQHRRSFGPVREALGLPDGRYAKRPNGSLRRMLTGSDAGGGGESEPPGSSGGGSAADSPQRGEALADAAATPQPSAAAAAPEPATGAKVPKKRARGGAAKPLAAAGADCGSAEELAAREEERPVRRRLTRKCMVLY